MPTPALSVRRPCCLLAVALALVLGLAPRTGAKPPDLPAPIIPDCAPADDQVFPPIVLTDEELEESHDGLTMGDRCAAMRTFSRCVLFALHPLSAVVRPDRCCEFDEEPPYPVIRIGNSEVSVRDLVCNAAATLCSGPFGPFFFGQKESEAPKPKCPAGGMMPAGNYCPQTHECPAEMKCPAGGEPQNDPENEARAHKAQELLIAAQIAAQVGDVEAACSYYRTVCEMCPGTCCAWEAAEHIRTLQAAMDGSADDKQEEEQNVCPSVKRMKESPPPDPDKALQEQLKKQAVNINYSDKPLRDALDELRSNFKINIFVDNFSLQQQGISLDMPVSIKLEGVSLKSVMNLMVSQLGLVVRVKEGVVFVTTPLAAQGPRVPQVYGVADLFKGKKGKGRKVDAAKEAEKLIRLIERIVEPKLWASQGGRGTIMYFPRKGALVISQDKETHEQIADLLVALRNLEKQEKEAAEACAACFPFFRSEESKEKDCPEGDAEASDYLGPVIAAYDVSDLVGSSVADGEEDPVPPTEEEIERGDRLMRNIKKSIAPTKWAAGSDALEYYPETRMLVVRQPQEVQEQVAHFLAVVRKSAAKTPSNPAKNAQGHLCMVVYSVSDLLASYAVGWERKTDRLFLEKKTANPGELMRLIQEGVAPESWECHGGRGTISYNPIGEKLLIQQTPEVQQAIREFLDARRREIELHKKGCERQLKGCKADPKTVLEGGPIGIWCSGGQCMEFEEPASCFGILHSLQISDLESWGGATALLSALASDPLDTWDEPCGRTCLCFPRAKPRDNVRQLLDACHKALKEGRLAEAEMLASRALCLDPMRVKVDPMVHRMLLLNQVLSRAVTLQPLLPAIDFNIVQAYNEILGMAPPRLYIEVHETGGTEESEDDPQARTMPRLFLDQDGAEAVKPSLCFDLDQTKGRVRCQLQFGFGTLCFVRDEDGHNSVELALPSADR